MTPLELVEGQLAAYNQHDLEVFCQFFSNDVIVRDGRSNEVLFEGMVAFRERYAHTFSNPKLHCHLLNRIEQGDVVIDHERVEGLQGGIVFAIAVYEVQDFKIQVVRFY